MTQFVPNSYPDFDTDSSGMHVAFRDRGGSHHGLVTYQTGPGGGNRLLAGGQRLHTLNPRWWQHRRAGPRRRAGAQGLRRSRF